MGTGIWIESFRESLLLSAPMVLAGILHMVVVTYNLGAALEIPIHRGLFGANKTIRGFVVMPLFCAGGVWLTHGFQEISGWSGPFVGEIGNDVVLGALLGLGYCAGELPNSWMKRRLGIPPGETLAGTRWLTFVTDHLDSLLGCLFVYLLFLDLSLLTCAFVLVLGPVIHTLINLGLFAVGLRKQAL